MRRRYRRLRRAITDAWWHWFERHIGPVNYPGFDAWWSFRHRRCVAILRRRPEYRAHDGWRGLCRSCRREGRWDR